MKTLLLILSLPFLAACTSFTTSIKKAEMAAVHTGVIAMQGWAMYYKQATNTADAATLADLNAKRAKFNSLSIKLGTAAQIVDATLASFQTNGVGKIDVQATLSTLASNATTITLELQQILTQ